MLILEIWDIIYKIYITIKYRTLLMQQAYSVCIHQDMIVYVSTFKLSKGICQHLISEILL
ncbi:hypothetical protein PFDG_01052 [Plasmodium falciparum Dd2]|uniref:Uncharacterized protein n=1 Tax=Plasmodium falciparum (isolate Dd2) TaxID=57267 RepID=A0A0L7LYE8_PLAF4|nr:hypothetical protein PFDG_01052 [Plasmodium falciparum Dd2]